MSAGDFAAVGLTFYAAHHIGDYWIQTDHQARHKGLPSTEGRVACLAHVLSYVGNQFAFLLVLALVATPESMSVLGMYVGLLVSGVTHYVADRREHGLMFKLARLLPGKAAFLELGVPREPWGLEVLTPCSSCHGAGTGGDAADESTCGQCWDCRGGGTLPAVLSRPDNPTLGTGAWALDQSWHILFSVFVPALLAVSL